MEHDPLSTLLVGRLTRLLDLNCLEEVKSLEDCGYVKQNIEIETNGNLDYSLFYETQVTASKGVNQFATIFRSLSRKQEQNIYGVVIPRDKLETIVQLIDYLKTDASAEGLFRISGNKKRQVELKNAIQKGQDIYSGATDLSFNTHDISGILKEFFGELKDPLLTKQLYDCYQQLASKFSNMDIELAYKRKLETLQTLFLLLPPLNRYLLKKLVELLSVVAKNEDNKMDAYNLGVVFAPNIICTRQVTGSAEFTDNMEPFTDLMKFIIENALQVFKIPEDFLEEANEYTRKLNSDNEDVPMRKTFCHRIDSSEYRKEAQTGTNEAITMLYAQILEMPDGAKKNEFLEKFNQSYPGTPLFIPKSVQNSSEFLSSPRTPIFPSDSTDGCSAGGNSTDRLLFSPERKHDELSRNTIPSSPGDKLKHCLKRVRRASQEILNPKSSKIPSSDNVPVKLFPDDQLMKSVGNETTRSKMKSKLQAYKKTALRNLRRSLSSPALTNELKGSSSCGDSCEDIFPYQSFHDDSVIGDTLYSKGENMRKSLSNLHHIHEKAHRSMDKLNLNSPKPLRCFVNLGCDNLLQETDIYNDVDKCELKELNKGNIMFQGYGVKTFDDDKENLPNINTTPLIRKSLYPFARTIEVKDPETPNLSMPVICKSSLSRGVPLVNKSLTLENMRKIRERKLMANDGNTTSNDTSVPGKEYVAHSFSDEILRKSECTSNPISMTELASDHRKVNLNKFCHISLLDSPRSDAKDSITRTSGQCTGNTAIGENHLMSSVTDIKDRFVYYKQTDLMQF